MKNVFYLSIELPDDDRSKCVYEILHKYSIDYMKFNVHSIVPPNRIKYIFFNSNKKMVYELCEIVNSTYTKEDFVHQSKFGLTAEEQKTLLNISLK